MPESRYSDCPLPKGVMTKIANQGQDEYPIPNKTQNTGKSFGVSEKHSGKPKEIGYLVPKKAAASGMSSGIKSANNTTVEAGDWTVVMHTDYYKEDDSRQLNGAAGETGRNNDWSQ